MICVKVQKPQITTVSTDPSITRAGSPWIFRCLADDRKQAGALASYICNGGSFKGVAILALDDRYGRMGSRTCRRLLEEKGLEIVFDEVFEAGIKDRAGLAERTGRSKASVIVLWSLYAEAAEVVKSLRLAGINTPVVAPDGVTTSAFLDSASLAAEGMIVTLPFNPLRGTDETRNFLLQYKKRWGEEADSFAAHAYDGMNILALAIKRGGIDAFNLRDNLALTSNFPGVTGQISFDSTGNDIRDVDLAIVKDGKFVPLTHSEKR
jgi:branched-chain amino acid transport system substrate-binding protein